MIRCSLVIQGNTAGNTTVLTKKCFQDHKFVLHRFKSIRFSHVSIKGTMTSNKFHDNFL